MKLQSAALHAGPQLAQDSTWYPGSLLYILLCYFYISFGESTKSHSLHTYV